MIRGMQNTVQSKRVPSRPRYIGKRGRAVGTATPESDAIRISAAAAAAASCIPPRRAGRVSGSRTCGRTRCSQACVRYRPRKLHLHAFLTQYGRRVLHGRCVQCAEAVLPHGSRSAACLSVEGISWLSLRVASCSRNDAALPSCGAVRSSAGDAALGLGSSARYGDTLRAAADICPSAAGCGDAVRNRSPQEN